MPLFISVSPEKRRYKIVKVKSTESQLKFMGDKPALRHALYYQFCQLVTPSKPLWITYKQHNSGKYKVSYTALFMFLTSIHQINAMVIFNKSDVKRLNAHGCLDQYTCKRLILWNSQDCNTIYVNKYVQSVETVKHKPLKQSRYSWPSGGYVVFMYFLQSLSQKCWL